MVSVALRIRIDRHALTYTTVVGERVSIVTEGIRISKSRARLNPRTGLRNIAVGEFVRVRGIASGDASVNHNRSAGGCRRRRAASSRNDAGLYYVRVHAAVESTYD